MYSGITKGLFPVVFVDKKSGLTVYAVKLTPQLLHNLKIGDSVAIDGVCQSVVNIDDVNLTFNAIGKTLALTTLDSLVVGRMVSVERSLGYGDENGGHQLAGHVFEKGTVVDKIISPNNVGLIIKCSEVAIQYVFDKGFIGLDGSSLTVHNVNQEQATFEVHLIPETLKLTNFGNKQIGDNVNIEFDSQAIIIAETIKKYFSAYENKLTELEAELAELKKSLV